MKKLIFLLIVMPFIVPGQGNPTKTGIQQDIIKADSVEKYITAAEKLRDQGKIEDALINYRRACEIDPRNEEAFKGWLGMSIHLKGVPEGGKVLDQWIVMDSTNVTAWNFKGIFEAETGHPEAALRAFEKAVEIQPDSAVAWVGIGQMRYEMQHYDVALEAFNKALESFPERYDVWGMKASTQARLGKYDDALSTVNKAMEMAPNDPSGIYNRACIYSLKGDKANALADLNKAISLEASFKRYARGDKDFEGYWADEDFIALTK